MHRQMITGDWKKSHNECMSGFTSMLTHKYFLRNKSVESENTSWTQKQVSIVC